MIVRNEVGGEKFWIYLDYEAMTLMWKKILTGCLIAAFLPVTTFAATEGVRIKDLGKVQGWRENALVGYGIVTGLAGTGDSANSRATKQALSNVLSQFSLLVSPEQIQSRNVAVVMMTATLPAFSHEGDVLDVSVTSIGDARSLVGGSLLMAPLRGPNGKVYALAQGSLTVGGYRYDSNGNVIQKNHPTVGAIPGGATIEVGVLSDVTQKKELTFVLADPDFTTASRIAEAINQRFGSEVAEARDPSGVEIHVPPSSDRKALMSFMAKLESVTVDPDRRARVIINERTGTVVMGGDVRISKIAISHGDLKISVASDTTASQPIFVSRPGAGINTVLVTNTKLKVNEDPEQGFVPPNHNTVADLVQALSKMKIGTRDVISILRAIKSAGALHGELIIQ